MNKATKCLECGSLAILYCHPNQYAGIWECQNPECGASDTHEHSDHYEVETVEDWPTGPLDNPQPYQVYVCGGEQGCGVTIPLDEADPAESCSEALAWI